MSRPYRPIRQRKGITAVMAMLYMVLFATMALGFYATVTTSVALAKNDQKGAKALLAAESGVQFMRYHLANVAIPPLVTESTAVMEELYNDLHERLASQGNLTGLTIGFSDDKQVISIPKEPGAYIKIEPAGGDNSGFAVVIKQQEGNVICKVMGRTGDSSSGFTSSRGVSLDFTRLEIESNLFDNAVAARGRVKMRNGTLGGVSGIPNTIANIMSAMTKKELDDNGGGYALSMTGGTVGGLLGVVFGVVDEIEETVNPSGLVSIVNGSVHGTSSLSTIYHKYLVDVKPPEFPVIDTTIYAQYATNPYVDGASTYKNVRIPAGTNPKFAGGTAVQGIMYVESPNTLEFMGNTNLQGFIVWDNGGSSATNSIKMTGNFSHSVLPNDDEWGDLATITGVAIMAPHTSLLMSGSTESQIKGNVIVGKFENAGANTITFDKGSLVAMDLGDSIIINTAKSVRWISTGFFNQPSEGATFSSRYDPVPGSYQELNQ